MKIKVDSTPVITAYDIGDLVYVKTDPEQQEYTVIAVTIRPGFSIIYEIDFLGDVISMYDFQVTKDRDELKKLLNKDKDIDNG